MSASRHNTSMPPGESVPDAHSNTVSTGGEQNNISLPEQAPSSLAVEDPSELSSTAAVRSTARTAPTRPTSSSSDPAVPSSKPVPELPREHAAEPSTPVDVRPPVVSATLQVPALAYGGRGSGGGGREREDILPRRSVRVSRTRSDATLDATMDEAVYAPRSVAFPSRYSSHRRSRSRYLDSESAWHDGEPVGELNVGQRLDPTIGIANEELVEATKRAETIAYSQKVALTLQVLLGALITALGAALKGSHANIVIATLGVSSTLVAWYLARTRESDEPHKSRLRVRDLGHFLREVELFVLDCGHEPGNKWETKINGFRLTLEKILGIIDDPSTDPNSTADSNANRGKGSESDASSKGDGNQHSSAV